MEILRIAVSEKKWFEHISHIAADLPVQVIDWNGDAQELVTLGAHVALAPDSLVLALQQSEWVGTFWVGVENKSELPASYADGVAEDILLIPIERLELITKIRWVNHLQQLRDLEKSSRTVSDLVKKLEEDLHLAEKIQRRLIRERFPEISGVDVKSKYYCGLRSGGDYFDVFQAKETNGNVCVFLSDSSSYQLSSKLLQALTRTGVMGKAHLSPTEVIAEIYASLKEELMEKDRLGLFYGVLNRRTFDFTYLAYGDFWLLQSGNAFSWHLMGNGTAHLHQSSTLAGQERKLQLQPGERLLLTSDGVREAIGAEMEQVSESTFRHPDLDGQSIVNELSYSVKKGLGGEFPPQDCSLLLFTMPDKALRLAQ